MDKLILQCHEYYRDIPLHALDVYYDLATWADSRLLSNTFIPASPLSHELGALIRYICVRVQVYQSFMPCRFSSEFLHVFASLDISVKTKAARCRASNGICSNSSTTILPRKLLQNKYVSIFRTTTVISDIYTVPDTNSNTKCNTLNIMAKLNTWRSRLHAIFKTFYGFPSFQNGKRGLKLSRATRQPQIARKASARLLGLLGSAQSPGERR